MCRATKVGVRRRYVLRGCSCQQPVQCVRCVVWFIGFEASIAQLKNLVGDGRRPRVVSNKKYAGVPLSTKLTKQRQDFFRQLLVEISGGLVCKHETWIGNKRASDHDALPLT